MAVNLGNSNDMVQIGDRHVFLNYAPVDFGFFDVRRPPSGRTALPARSAGR
jgi:hypothetical protein